MMALDRLSPASAGISSRTLSIMASASVEPRVCGDQVLQEDQPLEMGG